MFNCGIIPMEKTDADMRKVLSQLPPEEATAFKRKFRKLWRKAMRMQIGNGKTKDVKEAKAKHALGVGKHAPSRAERKARKELVFDVLWDKIIEPLIVKFDNPDVKQSEDVKQGDVNEE